MSLTRFILDYFVRLLSAVALNQPHHRRAPANLKEELGSELGPAAVPLEERLTTRLSEGSDPKTKVAEGNFGQNAR